MEIGEVSEEVELEDTDQEFGIFPIIKIIRMVRSSLRAPRPASISQLIENMQQNALQKRTYSETSIKINNHRPSELNHYPNQIRNSSLNSSKDELKSSHVSVLSMESNSDAESLLKRQTPDCLKKGTMSTDSHEEAIRTASLLSDSSIGQDPPKLMSPLFGRPLMYRGSIHLKHQHHFTFNIDEAESEDSRSQKSHKDSSPSNGSSSSQSNGKHIDLSIDSCHIPDSPISRQSSLGKVSMDLSSPKNTLPMMVTKIPTFQ